MRAVSGFRKRSNMSVRGSTGTRRIDEAVKAKPSSNTLLSKAEAES